ncbi:Metallo-dependent hydrolase [Pisolithus marmoratus]|nr:Metallo-dependent hydrolase [Pisolithus marmoratus]
MATIAGPSAAALHSLSPSDIEFLQSLPKAELHAHLNGSIPWQTLADLAEHLTLQSADISDEIAETVARLRSGLTLDEVSEFFPLFRAIYAITSTPSALSRVTRDVLDSFLKAHSDPPAGFTYKPAPECNYIELRTTPRATAHMSRYTYLTTVLDEVEKFSADRAALIVSIDRRMSEADAKECVDLAIALQAAGRRVVGLDLCGDPRKGDVATFEKHFKRGKDAGLGITLHIAETKENTIAESLALLDWRPDRLGHATFLSGEHKALFFADVLQPDSSPSLTTTSNSVQPWDPEHPLHAMYLTAYQKHLERIHEESTEPEEARRTLSYHIDADKGARRAALRDIEALSKRNGAVYKPCIEICLSSNLLAKTVQSLEAHHVQYYLVNDHPVSICTDDTLPFRTTLLGEYAQLLAKPPLGLGLSRKQVRRIAAMGMEARFSKYT